MKLIGNALYHWSEREVFIYEMPDDSNHQVITVGMPLKGGQLPIVTMEPREYFIKAINIFPRRLEVQ